MYSATRTRDPTAIEATDASEITDELELELDVVVRYGEYGGFINIDT